MDTKNSLYDPQFDNVRLGRNLLDPLAVIKKDREGKASPEDVILAVNRLMGLAPARAQYVGATPINPIIPSEQAAKEAQFIYEQSGANKAVLRNEQVDLMRALMQKLGIIQND